MLDGASGRTLNLVDAPGSESFTIGTTVGPGGSVYFAGFQDGIFGFRPVD